MTKHDNFDTIVVGAGLAGLTAAATLSRSGRRVALLERNAELGGRARTDDLDGWKFNHGGHALYRNAVGHRLLQKLGIEPDGVEPPLAGAQLSHNNTTTPLPLGARSMLRTRVVSGVGKLHVARLLAGLPKLDADSHANLTVDQWLTPMRPDVQQLVKALVRLSTYSADTNILSADAAISQLAASLEGVLYLHDGWGKLCAQIAAVATTGTSEIITGQRVTSIERNDHGYVVTTDTRHVQAPTIIIAAGGPTATASMLGLNTDHFGPVGPAPCAAVLDLALDAMPAKHRFVLGVDSPTFFSVHSPPARLTAKGNVAAVAMRYLSQDDDGSTDEHRASLEHIAGLAGTPAPVRSRFLRSMTVTNAMPTAATGGMAGRPAVGVSACPGAFIAGDWVGPRGLLADAAIASGHDAAIAAETTLASAASGTLV